MLNNECRMSNDEGVSEMAVIRASSLIRHSSFGSRHFLNPVPDLIQLSKIGIPEPLAARLQLVLESIESRDKLVGGGLQRGFGIEFAFPREIDHREQQIADLVLDRPLILSATGRTRCGDRRDRL